MRSSNICRYFFSQPVLKSENFLQFHKGNYFVRESKYFIELNIPKERNQIDDITQIYDKVELQLNADDSLHNLYEQLQQKCGENIQYSLYSLDQTKLANVTSIQDLFSEPFYLLDSKERLFHVQVKEAENDDKYSYIKEYFYKNNLPLLDRKILVSYLIRLDNIIDINFGTKFIQNRDTLTQTQSSVQQIDKDKFIQSLLEAYPDTRNTQSDHVTELYNRFYTLNKKYEELREQRKGIMKIAEHKTKMQMFGGLMVLCGHFAFMGAGIYVYYSWDVMEPIGYFLNTGGAIYLSYSYFKLDREWTHSGMSKYLVQKNFDKIQLYDKINDELEEVRGRIKTNFIINL